MQARILPVIVFSQLACTSIWFAGNVVVKEIVVEYGLPESSLGHLVSAVQFGFIIGTLLFAVFTVADRFSPSRVFFTCALLGAGCNVSLFLTTDLWTVLSSRFLTGFFLAGIYPVGMKIAADWHERGLGKALGWLVGALVLGKAVPSLIKGFSGSLPWETVLWSTSLLSVLGALSMWLLVPDGPYRRPGQRFDPGAFGRIFRDPQLRSAAFGYFGHMWELYAFWAFVPVWLLAYSRTLEEIVLDVPLLTSLIIGVGGLACVLGGLLSIRLGSARTAAIALGISGLACLLSPLLFQLPLLPFIAILLIWGMCVVADSPQFSTLVAQAAPPEVKGTALTIVNSIGFAITIGSLQLLNGLAQTSYVAFLFLPLLIGPLLGLLALRPQLRPNTGRKPKC